MYSYSKYTQQWINDIAAKHNLPKETVQHIMKFQFQFIKDYLANPNMDKPLQMHGLGRFHNFRNEHIKLCRS